MPHCRDGVNWDMCSVKSAPDITLCILAKKHLTHIVDGWCLCCVTLDRLSGFLSKIHSIVTLSHKPELCVALEVD